MFCIWKVNCWRFQGLGCVPSANYKDTRGAVKRNFPADFQGYPRFHWGIRGNAFKQLFA